MVRNLVLFVDEIAIVTRTIIVGIKSVNNIIMLKLKGTSLYLPY